MTLSVITVCYNDKDALARTITSIKSFSKLIDLEHIIVDGGSTDGTVDFIKDIDHNKLTWISETDDGIFDAFNKGILLAKGEWVHFLNAGDVYMAFSDLAFVDFTVNYDFICFSVLKRKKIDFIWKPRVSARFGFVNVAHPGLIVKKSYYDNSEKYLVELRYVSDSWFIWHNVHPDRAKIYSEILVDMEDGGYSTKLVWNHEREKQKLIFSTKAKFHLKISESFKYFMSASIRWLNKRIRLWN